MFKKQRAKSKHQWQSNLVTTMGKNTPQAEHALNVAMTHMICNRDVFKSVLLCTRCINSSYMNRQPEQKLQRSGCLAPGPPTKSLQLRSSMKQPTIAEELYQEMALIDHTPLFNVFASSPSKLSLVLDIINCTDHMADKGGLKDASSLVKRIFRLKNVLLQCFSDPVFLDLQDEFQKISAVTKHKARIILGIALRRHSIVVSTGFSGWLTCILILCMAHLGRAVDL